MLKMKWNMNEYKLREIKSIITILATAIILGWFGFQVLEIVRQSLLSRQIDECVKAGKVEYQTETGAKVTEPSAIWYERCLKDKGIR